MFDIHQNFWEIIAIIGAAPSWYIVSTATSCSLLGVK